MTSHRLFSAVLVSILMGLPASPAFGQTARGQTLAPAPAESPHPRGEVWYAEQLVDLSNVLGGAHYLRILCGGRGDQRWRDYMSGVISREPNFRAQLIEGFNAGYREEEARFEECDRAAAQMEAELRARGLRIADALRARHSE